MRPWKPLSKKRLQEIIADTEQECPDGTHCDGEIYDMARELESLREAAKAEEKPDRKLNL